MAETFGLKGVTRIVRLTDDVRVTDDGRRAGDAITIFKFKRRRKKSSKVMRPLEKGLRRSLKAQSAFTDSYLDRHEKSAGKKRDGWLRDLNYNVLRASAKYARALRR